MLELGGSPRSGGPSNSTQRLRCAPVADLAPDPDYIMTLRCFSLVATVLLYALYLLDRWTREAREARRKLAMAGNVWVQPLPPSTASQGFSAAAAPPPLVHQPVRRPTLVEMSHHEVVARHLSTTPPVHRMEQVQPRASICTLSSGEVRLIARAIPVAASESRSGTCVLPPVADASASEARPTISAPSACATCKSTGTHAAQCLPCPCAPGCNPRILAGPGASKVHKGPKPCGHCGFQPNPRAVPSIGALMIHVKSKMCRKAQGRPFKRTADICTKSELSAMAFETIVDGKWKCPRCDMQTPPLQRQNHLMYLCKYRRSLPKDGGPEYIYQ